MAYIENCTVEAAAHLGWTMKRMMEDIKMLLTETS